MSMNIRASDLSRCRWRLAPAVHSRARTLRVRCQQQPTCLGQAMSQYNSIVAVWQIPDTPEFPQEVRNSKVLMLDQSGELHSVYREQQVLTGAYWDCLGLLPAVVPEGPLLILGLGAGTIAHLIHAYYPDRVVHGWELDPAVVMVAEQHMGMKQLRDSGSLVVHVGDALADTASVDAPGAAGIIVDLFAEGQLIPQLTQVSSWQSIRQRLAPGGRVMTNLGAAQLPGRYEQAQHPAVQTTQAAIAAMAEAFDGQLTCCGLCIGNTSNMIVISGPALTEADWSAVPSDLRPFITGLRPYQCQMEQ